MKAMTVRIPPIQWTEDGIKSHPVALDILPGTVAVSIWIWGRDQEVLRITDKDGEVVLETNEVAFTHGPVELYRPVEGVLTIERRIAGDRWSPGELSHELVVHCRDLGSFADGELPSRLPVPIGWKIVEVFGHERYDGFVKEVRLAGARMLQITCPMPKGPDVIRTIAPKAVFRMHDATEEDVRAGRAEVPASPTAWDWRDRSRDDDDDDLIDDDPDDEGDAPIASPPSDVTYPGGLVVTFSHGRPTSVCATEATPVEERNRLVQELIDSHKWTVMSRRLWEWSTEKAGMMVVVLDDTSDIPF